MAYCHHSYICRQSLSVCLRSRSNTVPVLELIVRQLWLQSFGHDAWCIWHFQGESCCFV